MDPLSGLIPLDAACVAPPTAFLENVHYGTPLYRQIYTPRPVDETLRAQSNIVYDRPGVMPDKPIMPDVEKPPKTKKQRKTSIEGDTIGELVNNIIKEKTASLKLVNKAFQKMVDILEEERDELELMI
jgi:hypothetical protein